MSHFVVFDNIDANRQHKCLVVAYHLRLLIFLVLKNFYYYFQLSFYKFGRLAQLVRALLSHGRGHRFESRTAHSITPLMSSVYIKRLTSFFAPAMLDLVVITTK